jgi:hypothetical protein
MQIEVEDKEKHACAVAQNQNLLHTHLLKPTRYSAYSDIQIGKELNCIKKGTYEVVGTYHRAMKVLLPAKKLPAGRR